MKRFVKILILLIFGISITCISINYFVVAQKSDPRPNHCIDNVCISPNVFSDLPKYPSNFQEVWVLLNPSSKIGLAANFSTKYPDIDYWKQPEFYATNFQDTGVQFYTINKSIVFSSGSGAFPADIMISGVSPDDTFPVITYWHAGWAIEKYQDFRLQAFFPASATARMNGTVVVQDPEKAKSCFDIIITPENVILAPTYPKFYLGWTQKITAEITAKCSGDWIIDVTSQAPDPDFNAQLLRELGAFSLSQQWYGGTWQIFVHVN